MAALGMAFLVLAAVGIQNELVKANPFNLPPMPPITLTVYAPKNGSTYYGGSAPYEFLTQIDYWNGAGDLSQGVTVKLDGTVAIGYNELGAYRKGFLTELTNGVHYVEIKAASSSYVPINSKTYLSTASSGKIYFTVNGSNVVNPLGDIKIVLANFQSNSASFNFTTKKPAIWLGYSLDSEDTVTVTDDVAVTSWYGLYNYYYKISNLNSGSHNVTFHVKDDIGNSGQSNPYSFTIQETLPRPTPLLPYPPSPSPSPSIFSTQLPTLAPSSTPSVDEYEFPYIEVVLGVALLVVTLSVMVYLKRSRGKDE
jgi:hypothetical protein